jgi:uncharacterized membrane protein
MKKSHWVGLALALSVAVNLLVGGALLGRLFRAAPAPPPPMAWALRDLDPSVRETLRPQLRKRLSEAQPARRELRLALQSLGQALRQEPMDRDAASRALSQLRESGERYQAVLHESLLDILAELPAERREAAMRGAMRGKGGALLPGRGPHR